MVDETPTQAADRARAEAARASTEANMADNAKAKARAYREEARELSAAAASSATDAHAEAVEAKRLIAEFDSTSVGEALREAGEARDAAESAALRATEAVRDVPKYSGFGYQPTALNPEEPYRAPRRLVVDGDSSGQPNGDFGTPREKVFGYIVAERLGSEDTVEIHHIGGSTSADVALRMLDPSAIQYQAASNPKAVKPDDIFVLTVGGNDAGSGGFAANGRQMYDDGMETCIGLAQSLEPITSWIATAGTWGTVSWRSTQGSLTPAVTSRVSSEVGAKTAATMVMREGRGFVITLLAPVDATGANYRATMSAPADPSGEIMELEIGTTVNHGFGGDGTQLHAQYTPVPITFIDRENRIPVGTELRIEIENTSGGPLIVHSIHPWGPTPDIRVAPVLYQSDAAWALLRPEEGFRQTNDDVDTYYRPHLAGIIAFFANPKIKAIPARLYDTLWPYLAPGLRVADGIHANEEGQRRLAQAVYEGILGVPEGMDPTPIAFATMRQLARVETGLEERPLTALVQQYIQQLNTAIGERPLFEDITELSEELLAELRLYFQSGTENPPTIIPQRIGATYTNTVEGLSWTAAQVGDPSGWVLTGAGGGTGGANGLDGKDGIDGIDGRDGINGIDGRDGINGIDGRNGTDGIDGLDGKNGVDGADGQPGPDGLPGADGQPGADGRDGINGTDGKNGTDGVNGTNGINGADGTIGTARRDNMIALTVDPAALTSTYTLNASATMLHRVFVENPIAMNRVYAYLTVFDTSAVIQAAIVDVNGTILGQSVAKAGGGAANWYFWDLPVVAPRAAGTALYVTFTRTSAAGTSTFRASAASAGLSVPTTSYPRALIGSTGGVMPNPIVASSLGGMTQTVLAGVA